MSEFVTYIRLYTIIYNIQIKESGREENYIFLPPALLVVFCYMVGLPIKILYLVLKPIDIFKKRVII